jgi:hypothetical protein
MIKSTKIFDSPISALKRQIINEESVKLPNYPESRNVLAIKNEKKISFLRKSVGMNITR